MTELIVQDRVPKIFKPLDDPIRYKVMYGGRGASKSWSVAKKLLVRGLREPQIFLCTRELQKSIETSVHAILSSQIHMMGLEEFYTITQKNIRGRNGTTFQFIGVRMNADEIRSLEGVDVCWIEEAHNLTQESFDVIDPTIRKPGSEIWMTYNTRFKFDTIHKMFVVDKPPPGSWVQLVNHSDNPFFPDVLQKQMDHMKETDYQKYLHIWEGQLKQLAAGAIFGKQVTQVLKEKRLCRIPLESNIETNVFFDVGKNDETAIWFMQQVGPEYRFVDYYQNRLQDVEHYTKVIKDLGVTEGYNYGTFYLPHDADHDRLGMVRNIAEQFADGGLRPQEIVDRIQHKEQAIEMARDMFSKCWFHKDDTTDRGRRMEKGFEALCNYRYKYKEADDVFHQVPHHDWASNGADSFMQCAQGYLGGSGFGSYNPATFDPSQFTARGAR